MKKIRYSIMFAFLIIAGCTHVGTHQAGPKISASQYELIHWMTRYYQNPSPNEFINWLQQLSAEGLLRNEKKQFPFLGFAATVFNINADKVSEWIKVIDSFPKQDKKTILVALWLSDTKESRDALSDTVHKKVLQGHNYFHFDMQQPPPNLNEIDKYWGFLDIQWGRFLASGSEEPIVQIVSILEFASFSGSRKKYPDPKTKEEKWAIINEALYKTAMRSLRSNCKIHPRVLEICEQIYKEKRFSPLAQKSLESILIEMRPQLTTQVVS